MFSKLMKAINPEKPEAKQKQEKNKGMSAQELIPLKDVENGMLITPDNRMVQFLKVSAINLELTSNAECNEIFEIYEGFLKSLTYPIQTTNVSMPVDLRTYISKQDQLLALTKNPHKRALLESYIGYSKDIEINQDIMQRQRYIVFYEQMKDDTPEERHETSLLIEEKKQEIIDSLTELELEVEAVTDLEIIRYLHTMFDYSTAQRRPIESPFVPQIIQGGKL